MKYEIKSFSKHKVLVRAIFHENTPTLKGTKDPKVKGLFILQVGLRNEIQHNISIVGFHCFIPTYWYLFPRTTDLCLESFSFGWL